MKFEINVKPPTRKEMAEVAKRWWEPNEGVNFSDWNPELLKYSYPLHIAKVSKGLLKDIVTIYDGKMDEKSVKRRLDKIVRKAQLSLGQEEFFFKLITRSPKDSMEELKFSSSDDILQAMGNSMRMFDDLCLLCSIPEKASFVFRPFVKIEKHQEFRVFVYNKKIIAISQYHYMEVFPEIIRLSASIELDIRVFIDNTVTPLMGISAFVADVVIPNNGPLILMETNPFGQSDPCLFTYHDMDGSFRFVPMGPIQN